jgi:hypothetical protein
MGVGVGIAREQPDLDDVLIVWGPRRYGHTTPPCAGVQTSTDTSVPDP